MGTGILPTLCVNYQYYESNESRNRVCGFLSLEKFNKHENGEWAAHSTFSRTLHSSSMYCTYLQQHNYEIFLLKYFEIVLWNTVLAMIHCFDLTGFLSLLGVGEHSTPIWKTCFFKRAWNWLVQENKNHSICIRSIHTHCEVLLSRLTTNQAHTVECYEYGVWM